MRIPLEVMRSSKSRVYQDRLVLRSLADKHLYPNGYPAFSITEFEKSRNIHPFRQEGWTYDKFLKYHPDIRTVGRTPFGQTFWFQVYTLLPDHPLTMDSSPEGFMEYVKQHRNDPDYLERIRRKLKSDPDLLSELETRHSLAYVIGRIMLMGLRRKYKPQLASPDLDPFTNALLFIYSVVSMLKQKVEWIACVNSRGDEKLPRTYVPSLTLTPDTLLWNDSHRRFIMRLWSGMNLLRNSQMFTVASSLLHSNVLHALSAKSLATLLDISVPAATDIPTHMFSRRFILSPNALGLRYRFIFFPGVPGPVNIATYATTFYLSSSPFRSVQVHLEPVSSGGPRALPDGAIDVVVDNEVISIRYDLFKRESGEWVVAPWNHQGIPDETLSRLCGSTLTDRMAGIPPRKEFFVLSRMCWNISSRESQHLLLRWLGEDRWNPQKFMQNFMDSGIIDVVHHPRLELAGLPEVFLLAIRNARKKEIDWAISWFRDAIPFARILLSRDGRNLVTFLRTPRLRSVLVRSKIREELEAKGLDFAATLVHEEQSSYISLPTRLYPFLSDGMDPWSSPGE